MTTLTNKQINILLVEDHEFTRMGLAMKIENTPGFNLVAQATDGTQGVMMASQYNPDVILMDIGLPKMDGITATKKIKEELKLDCAVLMFTSRDSKDDIFAAFKAGADGYIMKGASPEQTISAIKAVNDGVGWIDPAIAKVVFSSLHRPSLDEKTENISTNINKAKNAYGLTERELDVLSLMVEGLSNPQIADKLVITRATAKAHVHSILQKLCATTRTQATVTAMKEGLV